jgi:hypothetical protein
MKNISTSSSKNSAMAKFIVTKLTCLNCKTAINSGAVCKNCKHKTRELFLERKLEVNYYERLYNGKA